MVSILSLKLKVTLTVQHELRHVMLVTSQSPAVQDVPLLVTNAITFFRHQRNPVPPLRSPMQDRMRTQSSLFNISPR